MKKSELRRFKKSELLDLAKNHDFGFTAKTRMTKIELVENIFRSPYFKKMKSELPQKEKKKVSQKVLDNLKAGREKRKALLNSKLGGSPAEASKDKIENKKEKKIVQPKEEKAAKLDKLEGKVLSVPNDKIITEVVDAPTHQVAVENEGVPYESLQQDKSRAADRRNTRILEKGANSVSTLSGEKKAVINEVDIKRQNRDLEPVLESAANHKEAMLAAFEFMENKKAAAAFLIAIQEDRKLMAMEQNSKTNGNIKPEVLEQREKVKKLLAELKSKKILTKELRGEPREKQLDILSDLKPGGIIPETEDFLGLVEQLEAKLDKEIPEPIIEELPEEKLDISMDRVENVVDTSIEEATQEVNEVLEEVGQAVEADKYKVRYEKLPDDMLNTQDLKRILGVKGNLSTSKQAAIDRINRALQEDTPKTMEYLIKINSLRKYKDEVDADLKANINAVFNQQQASLSVMDPRTYTSEERQQIMNFADRVSVLGNSNPRALNEEENAQVKARASLLL